jgi:DNA-binding response OmpR family regulator
VTQPVHVLLVDDQPKGLESLDFRLKRAGYRTSLAENGELGLQLARTDPPALVILDVSMPELNGYQTCRELKKLRPDLPVIMFTGKSDPADRFWASECGADAFIVKPADPALVMQKLTELLGK